VAVSAGYAYKGRALTCSNVWANTRRWVVDDAAAEGMSTASPLQELRELPLDVIEPNLSQPRRYFDEATLDALADSLRGRGVLQPVLVRSLEDGKYELIVGERRWRAAKIAGLQSIPALVCPFDDGAALEAALIENMVRERS
jgi:ParB/RepB/Spo0J family partition protein